MSVEGGADLLKRFLTARDDQHIADFWKDESKVSVALSFCVFHTRICAVLTPIYMFFAGSRVLDDADPEKSVPC